MALTKTPIELSSTPSIVDGGNATAITIDSSENVGIGRVPRVMLDVAGEAAIAYNATYGLRFYNQSQNNWSFIGNDVTTSGADLRLGDSSGEVMRLSGGKVGVGTSSPTHNLTIGDASASDYVVALRGGVGGFFGWDDSANTTILQAPNTRSLSFRVNSDTFGAGTEAIRIDGATGGVGIGGVGNISPYGIRFAINGTGTGGAGLYFGSGVIIPTDNTPTISDANVDLGASNYRFKDIYLSGGVNFSANANAGGTTSETLDDYEEGTWTPTLAGYYGTYGMSISQGTRNGKYTKVGNLVTLSMEISNAGVAASGNGDILVITGLPFAIGSPCVGSHAHTSIASFAGGGWTSIDTTQLGHLGNNGTASGVWTWMTGGNVSTSGVAIRLTITYRH